VERSNSRNPSPPGLIDETLAGTRGVDAVRRLALDPPRQSDGSSLQLIRTKYKPGRKLTASYVRPDGRHVSVVWTPGSVDVLQSPEDPAMPELVGLHDPAHLRELIGFSGLVETLRYRPGQRHVLRVTADGHDGVHVKADRDDSGVRAVPVAGMLGPVLTDRCPDASLVEPVTYSAADRAAIWRTAPGESLRERLGSSSAARHVHLVGQAARVLHDTDRTDLTAGIDARDGTAEVASTLRAGEHIMALLPDVGSAYRALVEDVAAGLDALPHEAARFTHGDLKADNVLVSGERVRLLDLDRSGPADPALDLGKFVADLHWWFAAEQARELVAAFRAGYGDGEPARWERAHLISRLFGLKLTARRCAVHDPSWESDVRARVTAAAPLMARGA
jgi:aminoglycoside phosphotransferase (APT) family kinase protein